MHCGNVVCLASTSNSDSKRSFLTVSPVADDISVLANPLTWILLVTLVVSIVTQVSGKHLCLLLHCVARCRRSVWCVLAQVNYLNKSLDTFNTQLVYPIYYVLFTSVVLSTSIILFQEWRSMATVDVVTTLGAFMVIVVGVAMLHLFKEMQVCQLAHSTSCLLIFRGCWTMINLHATMTNLFIFLR